MNFCRICFVVLSIIYFPIVALANGDKDKSGTVNMTELIFGHTGKSHSFHLFSYKDLHVKIHLPVILYNLNNRELVCFSSSRLEHGQVYDGYYLEKQHDGSSVIRNKDGTEFWDFSLSKNVVQMLLVCLLFFVLFFRVALRYRNGCWAKAKRGMMVSLIEPLIEFVVKEIAIGNLGEKKGRYYAPYILTVFFFILINNLVGLIPMSANVTGNIAFTLVLALLSFVLVMYNSRGYYWKHIFWPNGPLAIKFLLIPIEIIGIFTGPFALMIRLFANMLAGHIVIICLISLIFVFYLVNSVIGWIFVPFSLGFTVFVYCIELLVSFIQAYIFANLTAVFIANVSASPENH